MNICEAINKYFMIISVSKFLQNFANNSVFQLNKNRVTSLTVCIYEIL